MHHKRYREIHDGLGTVVIDLELPLSRLKQLQQRADGEGKSVDIVIGDAIGESLVRMARNGPISLRELYERIDQLEADNTQLQAKLSKRVRKKLKRSESSPFQLYLPFDIPSSMPSPLSHPIGAITV